MQKKNIHSTGLLLFYADLDSILTRRHLLDIHLYFACISRRRSILCLCICGAHHLRLWADFVKQCHRAGLVLALWLFFMILYLWRLFSDLQFFLSVSASGSEEGAVFPPIPWGVFAPGRVCLHGSHVALPLRLHHHLHSAPQVRRNHHLGYCFCWSTHWLFTLPRLHVNSQLLTSFLHLDTQTGVYVISLFLFTFMVYSLFLTPLS